MCSLLKNVGKMRRLPGPGHPRFPEGLPIGFYYNICTDSTWYDTETRAPGNVCCKRKSAKFEWCPEDFEKLKALQAAKRSG